MRNYRLVFVLWFIFLSALISCSKNDTSAPSPWQKVNTPYFGKFVDMNFVTADTGYIIGTISSDTTFYNTLIKTFDGGKTWQSIQFSHKFLTDTSKGVFAKINPHPFNSNILFIAAAQSTIRSTDGGYHWTKTDTTRTAGPSIYFFDALNGVSAGFTISITKDSGLTWTKVMNAYGFAFMNCLQFTSRSTGYAADGDINGNINYSIMPKTQDGGNTWQILPYSFRYIYSMSFVNDNIGFIIMDAITKRGLYKTTDGGTSWNIISDNNNLPGLEMIYFKDEMEGFCAGSGIFHTKDGGKTWLKEYTNASSHFYFPDNHTGYAMDTSNNLVKRSF